MRNQKRAIRSTRKWNSDRETRAPYACGIKLAAFQYCVREARGSFTVIEYCTRFNIDDSVARRRMMNFS